jgi:hypothetical protein
METLKRIGIWILFVLLIICAFIMVYKIFGVVGLILFLGLKLINKEFSAFFLLINGLVFFICNFGVIFTFLFGYSLMNSLSDCK